MPDQILIALISAAALIIAAGLPTFMVERARKENAEDHATVRKILTRVEHKIDNHLEDHGNGFTRRNKPKGQQTR